MSDVVQRLEDMAVGRSQHATDRNDARSAADDIRAVIARLEAQAEPIVAPAECGSSCDDPECPYSHKPLTLRQAYENAVTRLRSAEAALRPEVEPVGVRCTGCGSSWDDDRLAEEKSKRPELISCCPERKIVPVYTHPAPRPDMERELAEVIEQRDYFKAEAEAGTEYIAAQREKIDLLGRERDEHRDMRMKLFIEADHLMKERDALAADKARLEGVEKPLTSMDSSALPLWRQIEELFAQFCLPSPPVRLRDELVTTLSWARYGEALDAALSGASIPFAAMPTRERMREKIANSPDDDECEVRPAPDKAEARREALEYEDEQDPSGRIAAALISNPARREGE